MKRWLSSAILSALLAVPLGAKPASAEHAALPEEPVLLIVSGSIAAAEAPRQVGLDLTALRQFPVRELRTTTYWHEGVQHFRGVPALMVLESLGVRSGTLTLSAADGYEVRVPLAALRAHEPIFALEWEGESIEDEAEGPVWLIFPYDRMSAEERERYTVWSVWALNEIRVGH